MDINKESEAAYDLPESETAYDLPDSMLLGRLGRGQLLSLSDKRLFFGRSEDASICEGETALVVCGAVSKDW